MRHRQDRNVPQDDPEQERLGIGGTVRNDGAVVAGCDLPATAFEELGSPVGWRRTDPPGTRAQCHGSILVYHCTLTVPPDQVARVDITVTATRS